MLGLSSTILEHLSYLVSIVTQFISAHFMLTSSFSLGGPCDIVLFRVLLSHGTYGMSLYIEEIYCDDLKFVVQLTNQWSAVNGKSKNVVIAQCHGASCLTRSSV